MIPPPLQPTAAEGLPRLFVRSGVGLMAGTRRAGASGAASAAGRWSPSKRHLAAGSPPRRGARISSSVHPSIDEGADSPAASPTSSRLGKVREELWSAWRGGLVTCAVLIAAFLLSFAGLSALLELAHASASEADTGAVPLLSLPLSFSYVTYGYSPLVYIGGREMRMPFDARPAAILCRCLPRLSLSIPIVCLCTHHPAAVLVASELIGGVAGACADALAVAECSLAAAVLAAGPLHYSAAAAASNGTAGSSALFASSSQVCALIGGQWDGGGTSQGGGGLRHGAAHDAAVLAAVVAISFEKRLVDALEHVVNLTYLYRAVRPRRMMAGWLSQQLTCNELLCVKRCSFF